MNIYKHELKQKLTSAILWSVVVAFLIYLLVSIFSGMLQETAALQQTFARFPKEFLIAFGMDRLDFGSTLGFFSFAFMFCQICLAIQAANYGFSLVSVEERDLTADFLLAKPVARTTILTSKLLAAITGLAITNIVVWISSFVFLNIYNDGPLDNKALVLLLLSMIVFQLFFLTVGTVISLLVKKVRSVIPFSMALVFGMYVLSALGAMLGDAGLEIISPFKHFDPNYIIKNGAYDLPLALLSVAAIVISVVGSYWLYTRRNIQAAA